MLLYNKEKYTFHVIENTLKYFYSFYDGEASLEPNHDGTKELKELITAAVHDVIEFENTWSSFCSLVGEKTGRTIISSTMGQEPSYSANLMIEKTQLDNLTRIKELHFSVSLLGPFYTVVGQDKTSVLTTRNEQFQASNYLVVSPENGFNECFHQICELIETRFEGFRFVPSCIYQQELPTIQLGYASPRPVTVFHALFNNYPDIQIPRKIGQDNFKASDWVIYGYDDRSDQKWQAYSNRN